MRTNTVLFKLQLQIALQPFGDPVLIFNNVQHPLPINERILMLDRALLLVHLFSPIHEMERDRTPSETRAYEQALSYISREYARGWREEAVCAVQSPAQPKPDPELPEVIIELESGDDDEEIEVDSP